ncbi:uncharacterized protein B0H64DRAFT_166922 [Chaetomium fimeti]|uniref:RING-type domain-containing protein n=1 Tax=Chaetomium fimeti TaxID=1854472 RepID=A0AAE0LT30_9PEZI|nr:hypothetical protein B0H64DRAFT_166922 [Chaetomium fimeti]
MPIEIADVGEPAPENPTSQWQMQLRDIIRLLQCPACSSPLKKPVTLPCGKTYCESCLPALHRRENTSWPGTLNRQWGIHCPDIECSRAHVQGDYGPDIMVRRVLEAVETVLQNGADSPARTGLQTTIIFESPQKNMLTTLEGGTLLAAYKLVSLGGLERSINPGFRPHECDARAVRAFDEELLAQIKSAAREELSCEVCRIGRLVSPLTTPCGHTFCHMCLRKSIYLGEDKNCPLCRRPLSLRFGSTPDSRPGILSAFLQHTNELTGSVPSEEAGWDTWGCVSEDRPMLLAQALFPGMIATLDIPDHYWVAVHRALEGDKILAVCATINGTPTGVGTLAKILENNRFENMSRIKVMGVARFRVSRTRAANDGCVVGEIWPLDDISLADEEDNEARETMGNHNKNNMTCRADVPRTATRCLSGLATYVIHKCLTKGGHAWLKEGAAFSRHFGQTFPYDPVVLPWWFANIAPISDSQRVGLLVSKSVRERLQICWGWLFDFGIDRFGL